MGHQITLESERLWLREFKWKDVNVIHQLHSDPEVAKYNTLGIPKDLTTTRDVMKAAIEDQDNAERRKYSWCILHLETQEFMGEAGMSIAPTRYKRAEVHTASCPNFGERAMPLKCCRPSSALDLRDWNSTA